MIETAGEELRHFVYVYLRGHENAIAVQMESRSAALASVAYATITWMMHPMEKRHGCWCITRAGTVTTMSDAGVENKVQHEIIATVDAREIAAVQVGQREVEPWGAE